MNPCPRRYPRKHLHVYPVKILRSRTLHRHSASSRASTNFLHHPARSLRRLISLLSTFGAVAGVQLQTSRSIKPRERDLGDLRLFVLVRFLTRPTNHPRHAVCASNDESKPVRPQNNLCLNKYPCLQSYASGPRVPRVEWRSKSHLNHWPARSQNGWLITRKARWQGCLSFQVAASPVRGRDFA